METGAQISQALNQDAALPILDAVEESWINAAQAAVILDVSKRRVLAMITTGILTGWRPGREWLVKESEVRRLVDTRRPAGRPKTKPS